MDAEYRQAELKHSEQEQSLSANIDSLLKVNDERQAKVDSLNRVVDALAVNANTPSPREVVRKKAADIHLARHTAIRKAVKNGELKTMNEVRDYDGGLQANFQETKQSIKDPVLLEEFMQAYYEYWNTNNQFYDSLALVLPEK